MDRLSEHLNSASFESADVQKLLSDWHRRAKQSQRVQYRSSNYYGRFNYILGIPTIVASTIVGTAIFASLENSTSVGIKISAGILSMITAVLAGLQTFLKYSEKSEKHRVHSAKYGAVRRDIELLMTFVPSDKTDLIAAMILIKKKMDDLANESQEITSRIKELSVAEIDKKSAKSFFGGNDGISKQ